VPSAAAHAVDRGTRAALRLTNRRRRGALHDAPGPYRRNPSGANDLVLA